MRYVFLLILIIPFCYTAMAQTDMLDKRSKIKKRVEKYYQENNRRYSVSETDSTLTYVLNDSVSLPATYTYYFDEHDRCKKQETIFTCDSCLQVAMQRSLAAKYVNWQKTGPESYYARFPYNTLMEPVKENGRFILRYSFIRRKDLDK